MLVSSSRSQTSTGPNHYSEREEEWLIRDYFADRRGGVFVDVGANHYQLASKTYYLETNLAWSGIAIEPQRQFAAGYERHRPRTKFRPFFVSNVSNETARLYVTKRTSLVASGDMQFVQQFGPLDEVETFNDYVERLARGGRHSEDRFPFHRHRAARAASAGRLRHQALRPSLVCIKGLLPVRQQILDYFAANDYVLIGKYMWVDLETSTLLRGVNSRGQLPTASLGARVGAN